MKVPDTARDFLLELPAVERFAFIVGYTLGRTGTMPPATHLEELRIRLGIRTHKLRCQNCGRWFPRTGKRGHPATRCDDCRAAPTTAGVA